VKKSQDEIKKNEEKVRELQGNVRNDLTGEKNDGIEEKTKNMFAFEETVAKLEVMDKLFSFHTSNSPHPTSRRKSSHENIEK
jgi:hypothetical protein